MQSLDEQFHEIAGNEVLNKTMIISIWAKAFSDANGIENLAIANYIKLRVQQLETEWEMKSNKKGISSEVIITCPSCGTKETVNRVNLNKQGTFQKFSMKYNSFFGWLNLTCESCKHRFKIEPQML